MPAGWCVARDGDRALGAAVLGLDRPGRCYGYVAAVAPGIGDRGIGVLLKRFQRRWALARDITSMAWTFDPLVARNARFNLTKLGAVAEEYEPGFYGRMSDQINGDDIADRFVARWDLTGPRAEAAESSALPEPPEPPAGTDARPGPDGQPACRQTEAHLWLRVPLDIVALRRIDPAQASAWRTFTREILIDRTGSGWVADGATRTGWYHLSPPKEQP